MAGVILGGRKEGKHPYTDYEGQLATICEPGTFSGWMMAMYPIDNRHIEYTNG